MALGAIPDNEKVGIRAASQEEQMVLHIFGRFRLYHIQ